MLKNISKILFLTIFLSLVVAGTARAGFGISPPYVYNEKLNRGSTYEQKIMLSRGNPTEDLIATITIDPSEVSNWLTIKPSTQFLLPKGQQQVPMFVEVRVPANAAYKEYKGTIRVTTAPPVRPKDTQINIVLGARVDVDLTVSNNIFIDFQVKTLNIPEVSVKSWPLSYWNHLKLFTKIENLGNEMGAPTKIGIDFYDLAQKNILASQSTQNIPKIKPFDTSEISVSLPISLKPGQYWANAQIYSGQEIKYQDRSVVNIKNVPFSIKDWLMIIIVLLIVIGIIILILRLLRRPKNRRN